MNVRLGLVTIEGGGGRKWASVSKKNGAEKGAF